jgi:HlyD family type I secretion membrane fusion protein
MIGPNGQSAPSDSARGPMIAGWIILLVFFGGLGSWAFTAPLNSAVVGEAVVKVEGNRKSVQHLDGGIVRELLVKEGDRVLVGEVLIVLDDTQVRAERDVLAQQSVVLRAIEARLTAELSGSGTVVFPPDLVARIDEPLARAALDAQRSEFDSRRAALAGEEQILEQRLSQLAEQIVGGQGQEQAFREQLRSVQEERRSLDDLFTKGLVTRPRLLQLERTATGLEGQIASTVASIATAGRTMTEYDRQITQIQKARMAEVTGSLTEVQSKLLDLVPHLHNAEAILGRMEIRSPYAGAVVDLNVHSVGAVIGRGERILDIVPIQPSLVVEARIGVEDISDLQPGMGAEVHFTSYKQRLIPVIHGTVSQVSADRLTDERTGHAYYLAEVEVDQVELAANAAIKLYPGMPATVMVTTRERTAIDYLLGPLTESFDRSFRQR